MSDKLSVLIKDVRVVGIATILLALLYIPAFMHGVASLWAVAFLFVFIHLGRTLCQSSLRRYEERLEYTNEAPKIKGIVIELCAYLSLPFLAYIFIIDDLNETVSSGLDRALILSLPLEALKLPIEGDPSVFQMLLLHQLLLSFFGWGGGMLYARKEIAAMSLPDMPKNITVDDDSTKEERKQHSNLWFRYYWLDKFVFFPSLFAFVIASSFFGRFWADSDIHVLEYVFVVPSIFFMPYAIFAVFLAIAFNCITWARSR